MSDKKFHFFEDISKMPCFRSTFLFSISAGVGAGLIHFMFTSKVRMSCHVAVGVNFISTLGYWSWCRYNYSVEKFAISQVQRTISTLKFEEDNPPNSDS